MAGTDPGKIHARAGLEETRQQGTLSFPCTMYLADSRADERRVFEVKPHWHDAVEILHFERGSFFLSNGMEQIRVEQEAFAFVESGVLHSIYAEKNYVEQAVLFAPELLADGNADAAAKEVTQPLVRRTLRFPGMVCRGERGFDGLSDSFGRIHRVFAERGALHGDQHVLSAGTAQLRVKAGLMDLLAVLGEEGYCEVQEREPDMRMEALKRTLTYIRENSGSRIYLRDLAGIMNMNEQYFCRFFKKATGRTPVAYINDVRLRTAASLLEGTGLSVADVAAECGCTNMGHFIALFRKKTGHTPLEYRHLFRTREQLGKDTT